SIEHGFARLVERYGEAGVFIGPPGAQASREVFGWPDLVAVTDLASARAAIELIVEQGEGAGGDWREAHFGHFSAVLDEFLAAAPAGPGLSPAPAAPPGPVPAPPAPPPATAHQHPPT